MNEAHALYTWLDTKSAAAYSDDDCLDLIKRCLEGDERAFIILYDKHATMIYRLAFGILQNREDAEEVLQDSFEYAFRKLANYNPNKSAFKTWLYRITVSRCHNKRRRKWLPTLPISLLPQQDVPDRESLTPDSILELDDQQKIIWKALGQLSPKLRETAILRYYHGLRYNEIGEILGISPKTAESRIRLAHKSLRKSLDDSEET